MKVSSSRLWLLAHCVWWARPNVIAPEETYGEPAATGKAFHSLAECSLTGGVPEIEPKANAPKAKKMHAQWLLWWPTVEAHGWDPEVPLLYDWRTRTVRRMARDWTKGKREREENEIPFVLDLLSDGPPARVWDYKTGAKESVADSVQVRGAALAAARLLRVLEIEGGIVTVRARSLPVVDVTTWDALDLKETEDWLADRMAKVPTSEPVRGDYCFRCKARSVCPEWAMPEPPEWMNDNVSLDGGQDG